MGPGRVRPPGLVTSALPAAGACVSPAAFPERLPGWAPCRGSAQVSCLLTHGSRDVGGAGPLLPWETLPGKRSVNPKKDLR